ncbi:MAG: cyclohexyl-isocyanide hydratase [Candidatus Azotimanducaceae bacterium]|jgi:cyclohexyl-isocyanide hydratase
MKIVMIAYPGMTPLDLMGPLQVWTIWPGAEVQVVWKNTNPVMTDTGMAVVPTHTFDSAFQAPDIIFVPGGTAATFELTQDEETLAYIRAKAETASWITSVCTGALVLGAAGLLQGYKATTHWAAKEMLAAYGAEATEGRYVIDRNRATGGGVTAGIDFGLALMAKIAGDEVAKVAQLALEYAPKPPFNSGTLEEASEETIKLVLEGFGASSN